MVTRFEYSVPIVNFTTRALSYRVLVELKLPLTPENNILPASLKLT